MHAQPNRYKARVPDANIERVNHKITLRPEKSTSGSSILADFSSNHEDAPSPDPQLIALHATCGRIAHVSGVVEFLNWLERGAEETRTL